MQIKVLERVFYCQLSLRWSQLFYFPCNCDFYVFAQHFAYTAKNIPYFRNLGFIDKTSINCAVKISNLIVGEAIYIRFEECV